MRLCPACSGTGCWGGNTEQRLFCPPCRGTGDADVPTLPELTSDEICAQLRIGRPLTEEGPGEPLQCDTCYAKRKGFEGYTCNQTIYTFECDGTLLRPRQGMKVMTTGHRPDKLGGYKEPNPLREWIKEQFRIELRWYKPSQAITGMALGIDQDFAQACIDEHIPFTAAIPFKGSEKVWPQHAQDRFFRLLHHAADVVYVSDDPFMPVWKAMDYRNRWMVNSIGEEGLVFAVWDGSAGGTRNCYKYAQHMERKIFRLNPSEGAGNARF